MGKKGLSDKVRNKQKNKIKQLPNPFEVKVNKVKHAVVNKKVQKWEKGLPGVSRSKAVKKRKDTLLRELHHMKKSNSLHDKRFGENDSTLTADEKMVQRFAMEKKKQMRQNDFNLNEEEEVLTHYGQSLAENLQDTVGSESEDEDNSGRMRTGDLQFGGFSREGDEVSWKDKMKEVIADSKKQKYERQAEKEKTVEATNELDNSWKTLVANFKPVRNNTSEKKKASSFMQLFHNLVLGAEILWGKLPASDKLKTEEEIAKEEAERLKKLEDERVARMKGTSQKKSISHISADDLNDGFALETNNRRVSFVESGDAEEAGSEEESDEEKEENGNEDADQEDEDNESEDQDEEGDDSGDDESDNFSDLASDSESESDHEPGKDDQQKVKAVKSDGKHKSILKKTRDDEKHEASTVRSLPFVYTAPGSYEELESLLHGHSTEEQATILSRLRKCHHPSLAEGNKDKLQKIQLYLLQYFGQIVKQPPVDRKLVDHVTVNLWEMTQMFQAATAAALQTEIVERQKQYSAVSQKRGGRGTFMEVDTLMYLQLVETLFPTSDFQHPVTTPAMHFITQMLTECPVRSAKDVISGLFLCSLALTYVKLSKRYVPEVVTFLHGLLCLGVQKESGADLKMFAPFRTGGKTADLTAQQKCETSSAEWSVTEMLTKEPDMLDNDEFRCEAVGKCVSILLESIALWEGLPCLNLVMEPLQKPLSLLPTHLYPESVQAQIISLKQKVDGSEVKKLTVMQQPALKPVPLKLFEPEIQEFWTGKRKKGGPNKEVNEKQRLLHKYKREMKAAIREVKRDNEVLSRHQLETVMQKDAERKRKTKDLLNSLANQEGDYKAMTKKKK